VRTNVRMGGRPLYFCISAFRLQPASLRTHFPLTGKNIVSMLLPEKRNTYPNNHAPEPRPSIQDRSMAVSDPSGNTSRGESTCPIISCRRFCSLFLSLSLSLSFSYTLFKANQTTFNLSPYAPVRVSAAGFFCIPENGLRPPAAPFAQAMIFHRSVRYLWRTL